MGIRPSVPRKRDDKIRILAKNVDKLEKVKLWRCNNKGGNFLGQGFVALCAHASNRNPGNDLTIEYDKKISINAIVLIAGNSRNSAQTNP